MTARTYDELFDPAIRLTLEQEGRNYIVCDGDTVYYRSPDINACIRFMEAMEAKREATVDHGSVERVIDRWADSYSRRVGALSEPETFEPAASDGRDLPVSGSESASTDLPADVQRLRLAR